MSWAACVGAAELRKPAAVPTPGGGREHGGDAGRWRTPEALRREQPPPRRVRWGAALAWLAPGPPVARLSLLAAAAVYVAFQKKLLGKAVSRMVARCYFWPTLPFTMALRWGNLVTKMDDTVNKAMYSWYCEATKQKKAEMWQQRKDFLKAILGQ